MARLSPVRLACAGFVCALALLAGSCFQPASTACTSGIVCPEGSRCSLDGTSCVSNAATCGNGQKDAAEVCDDGNILSGDGCRGDCQSDEVCGTGQIDPAKGEVCDDSNNIG